MASAAAAGGAGAGAGAGSGSKVVLWSKNGESGFEVEEDVAKLSGYVKELLEVANEDDSDNEEGAKVDVMNVGKDDLARVIEYLKYHKEKPARSIPAPLPKDMTELTTDIVSKWDIDFIKKLTMEEVFSLMLAADFMIIPTLLELTTAYVALMVGSKTEEEINNTFTFKTKMNKVWEREVRLLFSNIEQDATATTA